MSWQNEFRIDDGKHPGVMITTAVCLLVLLVTAAAYFQHEKSDAQGLSNLVHARLVAMKKE